MADDTATPVNPTTQKCRALLVIGVGTLVGLVRLGCGVSSIVVMAILCIYDIPYNVSAGDYILIPWIIMRVTIEVIASLLIFEDSLITKTLFGDRYEETKLLPSHLWFSRDFVRFCLRLIIAASFSCRAYENAATSTWTPVIADGYSITSLLILLTGMVLLILSSIPMCRRLCWIHYSIGVVKNGNRSCSAHSARVKRQIRTLSSVIHSLHICQCIPVIIFHLAAFTSLILGYSVACSTWRALVNHIIQAVVATLLILYAALKLKNIQFTHLPYLFVEVAQVHIVATVVSTAPSFVHNTAANIVIQCIGYLLLLSPVTCFVYIHAISLETDRICVTKWLRKTWKNVVCYQNISRFINGLAIVAAIFALIFALLAVPLPWFKLDFSVDAEFGNVREAKNKLQFTLGNATEELNQTVRYGMVFESFTCEVYIAASASGPFVGLIPGGSFASKVTREVVRKFKYFRELAEKGQRFLDQFVHVVDTLRNLDAIFIDAEKSMTVGLSASSWGLVLFLLPPVITGVTSVFVAFWPRDVRSCDTGDNKRFRIAAILVSACTNIVTFVFGLVLIFTGTYLVHVIAEEMPYVDARVIALRGGQLILYSYILSLVSWALICVHAVISLIKDEYIKLKFKFMKKKANTTNDAEHGLGFRQPKAYLTEYGGASKPMLASPDTDSDYQSGALSGSNASTSRIFGHIQRAFTPSKKSKVNRHSIQSNSAPASPFPSPLSKKKHDWSDSSVTSRERSTSSNRGLTSSSSGLSSDLNIQSRNNLVSIDESPTHSSTSANQTGRNSDRRSSNNGISKHDKQNKNKVNIMRAAKNTSILKDSFKNQRGNPLLAGASHSLPPMPNRPPPRASTQSGASFRSNYSDTDSYQDSVFSESTKGLVVSLTKDGRPDSRLRRRGSRERSLDPPEKVLKLKHNLNRSISKESTPSPRSQHRRHQSDDSPLRRDPDRPHMSPNKKPGSKVSSAVARFENSINSLDETGLDGGSLERHHRVQSKHHRSSEDIIGRTRSRSIDILRRDSDTDSSTNSHQDRFLRSLERRDKFLRQTSDFLQSGVEKVGTLLSKGGRKLHSSFEDLLDETTHSMSSSFRNRFDRSGSDCVDGPQSTFYVDLPQSSSGTSTDFKIVLRKKKRDRSKDGRKRRSRGYTSKLGAKYGRNLTTKNKRHSNGVDNRITVIKEKPVVRCTGCQRPKHKCCGYTNDRSLLGEVPPSGWCLSVLMMCFSLIFAVWSFWPSWTTMEPLIKPKWASLLGQISHKIESTEVLQKDLTIEHNKCDIFPTDLTFLIPTLLSFNLTEQLQDFHRILLDERLNLFGQELDELLNQNDFPQVVKYITMAPTFLCYIVFIVGFIASFNLHWRRYVTVRGITSLICKIALFVMFHMLNMAFFMVQNLNGKSTPLFTMIVTLQPGFFLAIAAQAMILVASLLLYMEKAIPTTYMMLPPAPPKPAVSKTTWHVPPVPPGKRVRRRNTVRIQVNSVPLNSP